MNDQLIPVPFYGDTVVLVNHNNEPYVVMKTVCDNIGLAWGAQFAKLKKKFRSTIAMNTMVAPSTISMNETVAPPVVSMNETTAPPVMAIIVTTGVDGKQREMVCLHLRKFPGWVYSIEPERVAPAIRDTVIRYQDECDEVLWKYWTQGYAARPGVKQPTIPQRFATFREIGRLTKEIKRETIHSLRRTLYAQLEQACQLVSIQVPPLEEIGHDALPDHESPLLEEFWEVVDALLQAGKDLNHARDKTLLALNLRQVYWAAADAKMVLPDMSTMRRLLRACRSPGFVAVKAVNSAHVTGTVKCWVFSQQPATQSARH